jgi:hypothetical protein
VTLILGGWAVPAAGGDFVDLVFGVGFACFFWACALAAWALDCPPFARLPQPYRGLALIPVGVLLGWLTWTVAMRLLHDDLANGDAFIAYAAFFLFMLSLFYDDWPFDRARQPWRALGLVALSFAGGAITYVVVGARPDSWLYFVPMFFIPAFAMWPLAGRGKAWLRGTAWAVIILLLTWGTEVILNLSGLSPATDKGSDFAGILFGGMLSFYCLSAWPFQRVRQPRQGIILVAIMLVLGGVILPMILWDVLDIPYSTASAWVFCAWYVSVFTQWLTAPWPSRAADPLAGQTAGGSVLDAEP